MTTPCTKKSTGCCFIIISEKKGGCYMIIAVDFDGTLCEDCYPEIGKPNRVLIEALIKKRKYGDKLILWTCREEELLEDAVAWCKTQGLFYDALNDNLEEVKQKYQHNSRKITADVYVDDKAVEMLWL